MDNKNFFYLDFRLNFKFCFSLDFLVLKFYFIIKNFGKYFARNLLLRLNLDVGLMFIIFHDHLYV